MQIQKLSPLVKGVTGEYKRLVLGILYNGLHNKHMVEELYSKVCEKAIMIDRGNRYIEQDKQRSYIGTITKNVLIDHFRTNKRMANNEIVINHNDNELGLRSDLVADTTHNKEEDMYTKEEHQLLYDHINLLEEKQRDAIIMRFFKNMSFKDICEEQGVSINTALGRVRYGLINLRKMRNAKID